MFVGRKEEINLLKEQYKNKKSSILLYGKRRVGKTTLLKESFKYFDGKVFYYECVKGSLDENLNNVLSYLKINGFIENYLSFMTWYDMFSYFSNKHQKILFVIDEYCYLKTFENEEYVDSIFQKIIDSFDNIQIVLSGSHISMMKSLLNSKNALYGRFSLIINLKEFNYLEASNFYNDLNVNDKIAFYSIFGGSPFVNAQIEFDKGIEYNIKKYILNKFSSINAYIDSIINLDLHSLVNSQRILSVLGNGRNKYNEIEQKLLMKANGLLSKHLKILLDLEILKKVYSINKKDDTKKMYYEINDNILRFYYAFVYKNKASLELIGIDSYYDLYIKNELKHFISRRFEDIVKQYFSLKVKKREIRDVYDIGIMYYDDSINKKNGEFDCVLKHKETYSIYEVKYLSKPIDAKDIMVEMNKIFAIPNIKINKIGLVSSSGFCDCKIDNIETISGYELYENKNNYNDIDIEYLHFEENEIGYIYKDKYLL